MRECYNHTHTGQNHTLRVEITLVRVEITVVSVVITFVRVKITLCVWRLHSVCRNHTLRMDSHSAYINYTQAFRYHTRERQIYTHMCQNYASRYTNHTLRVEIVPWV
jgi:hypothetical protein